MAEMKNLAKETAIYGFSSILGRFLNWGLMPFYTYVLADPGEYGVVAELYAYTAVFLVLLTYGMETGFFRFANKNSADAEKVYTTGMTSIGITSLIFIALLSVFLPGISEMIGYESHPEFIWMMGFIVAIDAFTAIPFAWIRFKKRPLYFAFLRLLMIFVTILFNLFFLWLCPVIYKNNPGLISWFYNPEYGVGYVFVANLISSLVGLVALVPVIFKVNWKFDYTLLKSMLVYSLPLLILGIAGIMNQSLDKMILKHLYGDLELGSQQLGIYTACFKIGVVMMMFTQAFRYAYEPFVFAKHKQTDNKDAYVEAMNYFIIFSVMVFLGIMYYLDILQYLIREDYRVGLVVVPVVLLCYIFQGISFNLSFWYKLTDKTKWGAYISLIGLVITVAGNILFVPRFGYIASAWSSFVCFLVMMTISWWLGKKYYPITYNLSLAGRYMAIGIVFFALGMYLPIEVLWIKLLIRTILLVLFVLYVLRRDIHIDFSPLRKKFIH